MEVEVLAKAIEHVYGPYFGDKDGKLLSQEAEEMRDFIHNAGFRVVSTETNEYVTDGPIQRALGLDNG